MVPAHPRAGGFAVQGGALVWVGDVPPPGLIGPDTEVIEVPAGQQVLPGLHDVHTHVLEAFHPAFTCTVSGYEGMASYISQLEACVPASTGWVLGWGFDFWVAASSTQSPVDLLSAAFPDIPVVVMESSSHAAWVNQAALDRLAFGSADPAGGVVLRDGQGQPTGVLLDVAAERAFDLALVPTGASGAENEAALVAGLAEVARNGITSIGDGRAFTARGYDAAWKALDARGAVTARAVVPLWAYPEADDDTQLAGFRDYPGRVGDRVRFSQVKLYSDGLTWITTGLMLDPYVGPAFAGPNGLSWFDPERLERYVTELERSGYDLHIHAIGDAGVRAALDAIDAARRTNGELGARHRITHVEWVDPADVPRFAALGVTADLQLSGWWTEPERLHDNDFLVGAERVDERLLRLRDLYEAGARVVLSSDYDVGPMSPFVGLARAIDRGDQSLPDLDAALRAVTIDAAWVLRQEDEVGSLEVGKRADYVVVDRDLWSTSDLAGAVVCRTVVDGVDVFVGACAEVPVTGSAGGGRISG